jgi:Zn-dependent M28 family amino/carboxypeptidase
MGLTQKICRFISYPLLWRVLHMPGTSHRGALPPMGQNERELQANLEKSVNKLALEIGERNSRNYAGLKAAETFIAQTFQSYGYKVSRQSFQFDGVEMNNVEAELTGKDRPEEIIVIGAHYDTVYGSPGADDNATGVAALLEIARLMADSVQGRTLRLVAFANEENPGGAAWETMGSYAYAGQCHSRGDKIVGMISLEMLGVYSDEPGSQKYPKPFNWFYPTIGNFIAFVGDIPSRDFVCRCIGSFRRQCQFPSEGVAAPPFFRDVNRSDHWSFWQFGYPAFMLTDTSNFRNKLYHTAKDRPESIDFERFARLTRGLALTVNDLVNG